MSVHGDWLLTPFRVAIHQPTRTAVLSDLHLGYTEARQRSGEAVPFRRLETHLAPLRTLLSQRAIAGVVIAGDLFEAGVDRSLATALMSWFRSCGVVLQAVIPGNHDRKLTEESELPVVRKGFTLGSWRIVHGDGCLPEEPLVQGHEHPCLRWAGVSAPCYLHSAGRLILPAFSPDASGVNVLGNPRWRDFSCAVIVGDRVLDFGNIESLRSSLRRSVSIP